MEDAPPPIVLPCGRTFTPVAGDRFFSRAVPRVVRDPARIVDMAALTAQRRWYPLEAQPRAAELVARRQLGALWFRERRGLLTGSKLSKFLGWAFGGDVLRTIWGARDALLDEMEHVRDDAYEGGGLEFKDDRDEAIGRERMRWGNDHEDDALATLLHHRPSLSLRECVLQPLPGSTAVGDSQDGAGVIVNPALGLDEDGMPRGVRVSAEFKCGYGDREPHPYRGVKDYYVPQCLLHCEVEPSERCYFLSWAPERSRGWVVPRNTALWNAIAAYVAALLAFDAWTLDVERVLAEAARLRFACADYAARCGEMPGSPFVSCFASTTA
jgi:hypothetical protein